MTAPAFTKGPWRVSKGKARRVTNEHGVVICNAVLRNQGGPKHKAFLKDEHEAEANADLIAAAPDLLEALQEELAALQRDCRWADGSELADFMDRRDRIEAVITKAIGE